MTPQPGSTQYVSPDLGFASTTLAAAQQNTLANIEGEVTTLNAALKTAYLSQFSAYAADVMVGRSDPAGAPKPPAGYVVGFFSEEANPTVQWAYPKVGTAPVCDMPPLPMPPAQTHPAVQSAASVMSAAPGDPWPVGYKIPQTDGSVWQKQAWANPFAPSLTQYVWAKVG